MDKRRRRYGFWTAALVTAVLLWASASSSVNYPLYADHWGLQPWVTTVMFAVYPAVLIPMLLVFGNISDYIGRRTAIIWGLGFVVAGGVCLGSAQWLGLIFIGRVLFGIGVGLAMSPATAAVIEFGGPDGAKRAGSTVATAGAVGLTVSMLAGGALVEYAPYPLYLNQWMLLVVAAVALVMSFALPHHTPDEATGKWRPRRLLFPRGSRGRFAAGVLTVAAAYCIGVIFIGLGAGIAKAMLHSDDLFLAGIIVGTSTVAVAVTSLLIRPLRPATQLVWGLVTAAISMGTLVASGLIVSLPLFVTSSVVSGVGYGMLLSGGLGFVGIAAPAHHRAAAVSTAYFFAYIAQAAAAVGLGVLETNVSYLAAVSVGAVIILIPSIIAVLIVARKAPTGGPTTIPEPMEARS